MAKRTHPPGNWHGVDALLQRWLAERHDLLRQYCALSAAVSPQPPAAGLRAKLDRFCETLVDYTSAGHFEVFCELFSEGERNGATGKPEVSALYRLIVPTTAIALDFNDRYTRRNAPAAGLPRDFSRLGETLASRFDWEDALIEHLHGAVRAVA